jgi:hypothetical protein
VSRAGIHVLQLVDAACDAALARHIAALAAVLRTAGARVSALCDQHLPAAEQLRAGGLDLLEAPLGDAPRWRTVQVATAWIGQEHVTVLNAHGGGAHALGALVGAITERPVVASIRGTEIPMLDLEAHRLGAWSHLAVREDGAFHQADTLGIARSRCTRVGDDPAATAELLLQLATAGDPAVAQRHGRSAAIADGARLR